MNDNHATTVSVWVQLQVRPDRLDEFREAIAANARASLADEPGCLYFDVIELDGDGDRFAFYELYRDRAAYEVGHRGAAHYATWRAAVARTVVPGSQQVIVGRRAPESASD